MENKKQSKAIEHRIALANNLRNKYPNGFTANNLRSEISEIGLSMIVATIVCKFEKIKAALPEEQTVSVSITGEKFMLITASTDHIAHRLLEMERRYMAIKRNEKPKEDKPTKKRFRWSIFWGFFKYESI